tara:strand:+ start:9323 stop:10585 length:1263 start_codon:yes stop_codon:yes gene_type:complete
MSKNTQQTLDPWATAVKLYEKTLKSQQKADTLIDEAFSGQDPVSRRRCQYLFLGALRHKLRLEHALDRLIDKRPRPRLWALLTIAAFELTEAEIIPKVVDHAVRQAKELLNEKEVALVNAVLRKTPNQLKRLPRDLATRYSHPRWLVKSWESVWGTPNTEKLLQWNQEPAPAYLRLRDPNLIKNPPTFLKATQWPTFFEVKPASWDKAEALLKAGKAYSQDPSTRGAVDLLKVKPGEQVLDLCAAPGGKSLYLSEALAGNNNSCLVSLDLPGKRLERLYENIRKISGIRTKVVEHDLLSLEFSTLAEHKLPTSYDAVLLDAPCSNTGVIRRRPDVRWRLSPQEIAQVSKLQFELLEKATEFVKKGGRLVYSTCSLEPKENKKLIQAFLKEYPNWECLEEKINTPWENNCDGAGAFLLQEC